jgi:hypothetical protein
MVKQAGNYELGTFAEELLMPGHSSSLQPSIWAAFIVVIRYARELQGIQLPVTFAIERSRPIWP